jgi:hypothetical protein
MASNSVNQNCIWKDVVGYEGLYQVNNLGEVRSLSRIVAGVSHGVPLKRMTPSKLLTLLPVGKNGVYRKVALCKNGRVKQLLVHRIVAMAFIPNPEQKPHVNHRNEIGSDNRVENLEWVTVKENANYGTRNARISQAEKGKVVPRGVNSPSYGLKRSAETRERMRQSALRRYSNAKQQR